MASCEVYQDHFNEIWITDEGIVEHLGVFTDAPVAFQPPMRTLEQAAPKIPSIMFLAAC